MRVKSYDHLNFSRAFDDQFRASRYVMRLNRTSEWQVMNIWISRELLFNFECLIMLCAKIELLWEKLWPFEFVESLCCSISSILIYYAPQSDLRVISYDYLNFSRAFVVQFRASRYIMCLNQTCEWNVLTILISWELSLLNLESVSICDAPESDFRVKSYDHLNFSRAFVVQFRVSWYVMCLNQTSEWKVMIIWISRELLLFNFERLFMWCTWIRLPS